MTDQAGRAELRAIVATLWNAEHPNGWQWDVLTSGEQAEYSDRMRSVAETVLAIRRDALAAVEADRDRLQGENARLGRALSIQDTNVHDISGELDEARTQLADVQRDRNEWKAAAKEAALTLVALTEQPLTASRPRRDSDGEARRG